MIQRIQTIYCILICFFNGSIFYSPLYRHVLNTPYDWVGVVYTILLMVTIGGAIVCILLFSMRMIQIVACRFLLFFQFIILGISLGVTFSQGGFGLYILDELIFCFMIFLGSVSIIIAIKAIKKDEKSIQSMHRLR